MLKAILLGALAALALPPITFFPVLLVCVPGLLGLIAAAPSRGRAFRLGYAFGFAHAVCGTYWITEAILIESAHYWWLVPFAVPLLAAALAVLTALPCMAAWHARSPAARLLLLAGSWVLANLAQQFIATGFPWNLWGSVIELPGRAGDVLIQLGALVGVHGITLLVLLLAGTPTLSRRWWGVGLATFAGWIGFGAWRLQAWHPAPTGLTAIVVQGNIAEGQKWQAGIARAHFDKYLSLSRTALQANPSGSRVLIWPETASPYLLGDEAGARDAIAAVTGPDVPAMIGSVRFTGDTPFNSLFVLDPPPRVAAIYDKWHLVPFGEYQPSWLPGIQLVAGSFGFGPGPRTLHVPGLPAVGAMICYEAVFTGQAVQRSDRPDWLVNITNDAWFGNSSGPRQHLAAVRMRAVEEALPLIRAANSGISAAFDSQGRELGRIGLNRTGFAAYSVTTAGPPTFYGAHGLFIPFALSLITVLVGTALSRRQRIAL